MVKDFELPELPDEQTGKKNMPVNPEIHENPPEKPEFTDEQLEWLRYILRLECCHVTGTHDPNHFVERGAYCNYMLRDAFIRIVEALDINVVRTSSPDCTKCHEWYGEDGKYVD